MAQNSPDLFPCAHVVHRDLRIDDRVVDHRVDGHDGNPGVLRLLEHGNDAFGIDGIDDDGIHAFLNVGLDRVDLLDRLTVRIEENGFGSLLLGSSLNTIVQLHEELVLHVDGCKRDPRGLLLASGGHR